MRSSFPVLGSLAIWSGILTILHTVVGLDWLQIPTVIVTILGTAVSFYLGFKGNSAYDRLWEARKIWGGIVNSSRTWGVFVTTMVRDPKRPTVPTQLAKIHQELVYRHVGWLAALRTQLRRAKTWEHRTDWNNGFRELRGMLDMGPEVLRQRLAPFISEDELDAMMKNRNQATQLIRRQGERIADLLEEGRITDFQHMQMAGLLEAFYTLQGKCERIKNFPLPRQYSTANHWFVKLFIYMLPLAFLAAFDVERLPEWYIWFTVPMTMIIGWVFYTWDFVVDYSENPFEGLINDIPMDALSRTIEIDLREMLGETEYPPPLAANDQGVLM